MYKHDVNVWDLWLRYFTYRNMVIRVHNSLFLNSLSTKFGIFLNLFLLSGRSFYVWYWRGVSVTCFSVSYLKPTTHFLILKNIIIWCYGRLNNSVRWFRVLKVTNSRSCSSPSYFNLKILFLKTVLCIPPDANDEMFEKDIWLVYFFRLVAYMIFLNFLIRQITPHNITWYRLK